VKVTVLGAGSWGSALAIHLGRCGWEVTLWALEPEVVQGINQRHRNPLFLPDSEFPVTVRAEGNLARACEGAQVVVFTVPVQFARGVLRSLRGDYPAGAPFVSASKGIEVASLQRMDEIVRSELALPPEQFVALSGPSFAREVAENLPTAAVLAGCDGEVLKRLQVQMSAPTFRFYTSNDVVGVELAGALKNVIAIAAGLAQGLGLGHNTLAALLTRGIHEITRLGVKLGGREETFRGLAGMGDLVLTCTGALSRNRTAGERLGRGEPLAAVLAGREVAEGVPTTRAAAALARRHQVDMPITFVVEKILDGQVTPREAVHALMTRQLKEEARL